MMYENEQPVCWDEFRERDTYDETKRREQTDLENLCRKHSGNCIISAVLIIIGFLVIMGNSGNDAEMKKTLIDDAGAAVLITAPIYLFASMANSIATFFFGIIPTLTGIASAVSSFLGYFVCTKRGTQFSRTGKFFINSARTSLISLGVGYCCLLILITLF